MNLNDYEKKFFPTYEAFVETVRSILEKALLAAESLPRPQSIQCGAAWPRWAGWTHRRWSLTGAISPAPPGLALKHANEREL